MIELGDSAIEPRRGKKIVTVVTTMMMMMMMMNVKNLTMKRMSN
jgi:hypothetical protein